MKENNKSNKELYTLRDIRESLGVSRRAIQGYEALDLVSPVSKNSRGYLLYDQVTYERIREIYTLQWLGFSLKEIREFIDTDEDSRKPLYQRKEKELMDEKKEIAEKLAYLKMKLS